MKKKFLLALFVTILGIMAFANISVSAETYGVLTYEISNGEVTITDCDISATGKIAIPETIDGYPVTSISDHAISCCDNLTSVTIPDSITSIGSYAFYRCNNLTSVNITDISKWSQIDFGEYASNPLTYAQKLYLNGKLVTELVIPDSVTSIGRRAFSYCKNLTSVTIPDSVISIGDYAFSNCTELTSVTISDSVTSIGDYAFMNCKSLTNINVDSNNEKYSSLNGSLFNKNKTTLIQYAIGKTDTYFAIPDSVTSIGEYAFSFCASLISVTISDSVTSIGFNAFSYCESLTNVTIPNSVTSIGYTAFLSCESLSDVYYGGTEEDWRNITIEVGNDELLNATIHFTEPEPMPEPEPSYKLGDPNDDEKIDIKDVISIRRAITGGYSVIIDNKAADVNKDNEVDIKDAIMIRRYITGGYGVEL